MSLILDFESDMLQPRSGRVWNYHSSRKMLYRATEFAYLDGSVMTQRSTVAETVPSAPAIGEKPPDGASSAPIPSTASAHKPLHRRQADVDPSSGQIRPISAEEWQTRQAELTRRLAEIDAEDDTPDGVKDSSRATFTKNVVGKDDLSLSVEDPCHESHPSRTLMPVPSRAVHWTKFGRHMAAPQT